MEIAGNSNTNHQSIIEFKGDWYFIYHNGGINTAGGSFRRSVCIDRLYYNERRHNEEGTDDNRRRTVKNNKIGVS